MTGRLTKRDFFAWAILLALTLFLFHRTLFGLWLRWTDWNDGTYSHGLLVPVFSLFLLFDRRERLSEIELGGTVWGLVVLAAAVLAFFAGRLGNMLFVQAVALVVALAGLVLWTGGWGLFKATALPIGFLIFMCPLPSGLYDAISSQLRLLASVISTAFLQIMKVSAYREGNVIFLPGNTMSVDDACSGIRSLFGILATAVAFAVIAPGGSVRKTFLVISGVPIAVFSNILRVTGTGLLQYYGSSALAEGFYHYLEGWVFYVLAMAFLFGEYFVIRSIFPIGGRGKDGPGKKVSGRAAQ